MSPRRITRPARRRPPSPPLTTFALFPNGPPRVASCRFCKAKLIIGFVPDPPTALPGARCTPTRNVRCIPALACRLSGGD